MTGITGISNNFNQDSNEMNQSKLTNKTYQSHKSLQNKSNFLQQRSPNMRSNGQNQTKPDTGKNVNSSSEAEMVNA